MPHPLRELAQGRPVYSIPLIIFLDDVSGNKSKQWNKHHSCYVSNGALPRQIQEKEVNVRFVSTSPHASPGEMMQAIKTSLRRTYDSPVPAYDPQAKQECLIRVFPLFFPGDNPMQALHCSQGGLTCNFPCRTCHVGGTREFKESDKGYATLFNVGELRTPRDTRKDIIDRLMQALEPNATSILGDMVAETGVKDAFSQAMVEHIIQLGIDLRKEKKHSPEQIHEILAEELEKHLEKGDIINPLLSMDGVDIHQDTPTEILHTILLGVVKYFWGQTIALVIRAKKFTTFQARLNSVDSGGLNIPAILADYMCHYRGSLVGKHFKTIAQVMPFVVHDIVPQDVLDAWLMIGELVVLLWHTEITDVEKYLVQL
ncbi:hypothetical protein BOTBODRAFT_110526 [Botryobasidium botryosum FD-172 SS1]|uniref:Uncharacterized protein n=1 Tax=Botryobasidium botryosum (strain FD-172 SS1) TaxID=930990 RepID=A0A067MR94_BOTB1|nr:hypothetical protein BOTBODRAFT_110526 [Botryobasidium botryosum FD-172 SS1]